MNCAGWETKIFWHSPETGSLLYILYKIPLTQACFYTRPAKFSLGIGERVSASFPACCGISSVNLRWFNVKSSRVSYFNGQYLPTFCLKTVAWHSLSITTFWISFLNTLRTRQNGCHFSDDIFLNKSDEFRLRFHWSLFLRVTQQYSSFVSDDGLALAWRQAIVWTNDW